MRAPHSHDEGIFRSSGGVPLDGPMDTRGRGPNRRKDGLPSSASGVLLGERTYDPLQSKEQPGRHPVGLTYSLGMSLPSHPLGLLLLPLPVVASASIVVAAAVIVLSLASVVLTVVAASVVLALTVASCVLVLTIPACIVLSLSPVVLTLVAVVVLTIVVVALSVGSVVVTVGRSCVVRDGEVCAGVQSEKTHSDGGVLVSLEGLKPIEVWMELRFKVTSVVPLTNDVIETSVLSLREGIDGRNQQEGQPQPRQL